MNIFSTIFVFVATLALAGSGGHCEDCEQALSDLGFCGQDAGEFNFLFPSLMNVVGCPPGCSVDAGIGCLEHRHETPTNDDCDACAAEVNDDVCAKVLWDKDSAVISHLANNECSNECFHQVLTQNCESRFSYVPTCDLCRDVFEDQGLCFDHDLDYPGCAGRLSCDEADLRKNCPDDVLGHVPANVETEVGEVEVGSVSSACADHGGSWSGSGKGVCTFNKANGGGTFTVNNCDYANGNNDFDWRPLAAAGLAAGATAAGFVTGPGGMLIAGAVGSAGFSTLTGYIPHGGNDLRTAVNELESCVNSNFERIRQEINSIWQARLTEVQGDVNGAMTGMKNAENSMTRCFRDRANGIPSPTNCEWEKFTISGNNFDEIKNALVDAGQLVENIMQQSQTSKDRMGGSIVEGMGMAIVQVMAKLARDYLTYAESTGIFNMIPTGEDAIKAVRQPFYDMYSRRNHAVFHRLSSLVASVRSQLSTYSWGFWWGKTYIASQRSPHNGGYSKWLTCSGGNSYANSIFRADYLRTTPNTANFMIQYNARGPEWDPTLPATSNNAGCIASWTTVAQGFNKWDCFNCKACVHESQARMHNQCSQCSTCNYVNYNYDCRYNYNCWTFENDSSHGRFGAADADAEAESSVGTGADAEAESSVGTGVDAEETTSTFMVHDGLYVGLGLIVGIGATLYFKRRKSDYAALLDVEF